MTELLDREELARRREVIRRVWGTRIFASVFAFALCCAVLAAFGIVALMALAGGAD